MEEIKKQGEKEPKVWEIGLENEYLKGGDCIGKDIYDWNGKLYESGLRAWSPPTERFKDYFGTERIDIRTSGKVYERIIHDGHLVDIGEAIRLEKVGIIRPHESRLMHDWDYFPYKPDHASDEILKRFTKKLVEKGFRKSIDDLIFYTDADYDKDRHLPHSGCSGGDLSPSGAAYSKEIYKAPISYSLITRIKKILDKEYI
jgi:hypothetical protein